MWSSGDHVLVPGCGDEDVGFPDHALELADLVALHGGLEGADRVDLGDDHPGALPAQRLGAALSHVAEAADHGRLAADHHVGGAVEAVDQRVPAAVDVVELRLGDRVVDVDRREEQRAVRLALIEADHAGGGLLGDTPDPLGHPGEPLRLGREALPQQIEDHLLLLRAGGLGARDRARGLVLGALVDEQRRVATVVEQHVRPGLAVGPGLRARSGPGARTTSTPPASRPSRRRQGHPSGPPACPPGPTATAAAAWSWVEKMLQLAQRTSAPSATSVSISTAVCTVMWREPVIRAPFRGLDVRELRAGCHQSRHLVLGEPDLLAAELGQGEVGDLEVEACCRRGAGGSAHAWSVSWVEFLRMPRLRCRHGGRTAGERGGADPARRDRAAGQPLFRPGWPARERDRLSDRGGVRRAGLGRSKRRAARVCCNGVSATASPPSPRMPAARHATGSWRSSGCARSWPPA